MRFCVVLGVLLLVSALNASAGELSFRGEPVPVCGTPRFHEEAKFLAGNFELKVLPPAELARIGKLSSSGGILEENVGDVRELWTYDEDSGVAYNKKITATLRNKTGNVYVYVELNEPGGSDVWYTGSNSGYITQEDVDAITQAFDDSLTENDIYGRDRLYFGEERPTGVDNDSHVTILLLDIDGDQSEGYAGSSYTGGYFYWLHEYANNTPSCPQCLYSNQRKMIFIDTFPGIDYKSGSTLWVPDRFHNSSGEGANNSFGTLAHELQHMIHWYQDSDEETWVDEGCADYAQYVNGLGHPQSHVDYFEAAPDKDLTVWGGALKDYGASYLWTLYLSEHYGGNQTIKALVNNTGVGIAGVDSTLSQRGYNASFQTIFPAWVTANYVDDASINGGIYGYDSIDLTMALTATKTTYPASGSDSVKNNSGDYIAFKSGNGSNLNLSFDGADTGSFALFVVARNGSGAPTVTEAALDAGKRGWQVVSSFGSTVKNATLIIVGELGGTYSYAAGYVFGVPAQLTVLLLTPNASVNASEGAALNVSALITCSNSSCGNVTASLNTTAGLITYLGGSPFYSLDQNPRDHGNLTCLANMQENASCNVTWRIIANDSIGGTYELFASANATGTAGQSSKVNITVIPLLRGWLSPYLIAPASSTNVSKYQFFNFTAGVACVGGPCGNVTALLDPNKADEPASTVYVTETVTSAGDSCPNSIPIPAYQQNTSSQLYYHLNLSSTCDVNFSMQPAAGVDYDFYIVWNGSCPSTTSWDCRPYKSGGVTESCTRTEATAGTYYSMVKYYNGNGTFNMTAATSNCLTTTTTTTTTSTTTTLVPAKGAVPYGNGTPFYTIDTNPVNASILPCLMNMQENASCNITWRVNATGDDNTTRKFFVQYTSDWANSNTTANVYVTIIELTATTTITHVTQNITEDIPANSSTEINASAVNVTIAVVTTANVSQASINVTAYAGNPTNASLGVAGLNKYYDIEASQSLKDALENILLRLHYTQAEVDAAGVEEASLAIYWLNESLGAWQKLDNNTMSWVYATGVNTTSDFMWANVSHFSKYAMGAGTQSQEIGLITGWNLISLPLVF